MVGGKKLEKLKELGLGIMISSCPTRFPNKDIKGIPLALDNGAYPNYQKGYPVMEKVFMETFERCHKLGLVLDFVTTPDIICGGMKSLDYSMEWVSGRLRGCPRLALVIQDGMEVKKIDHTYLENFTHLFMGGSVAWKWENAADWKFHASKHGLKFHIGQCGQLQYLNKARDLSVNSVDSSSIARNDRWDIIDEFRKGESLFNFAAKRESGGN